MACTHDIASSLLEVNHNTVGASESCQFRSAYAIQSAFFFK
jgi:hypothetical protein